MRTRFSCRAWKKFGLPAASWWQDQEDLVCEHMEPGYRGHEPHICEKPAVCVFVRGHDLNDGFGDRKSVV